MSARLCKFCSKAKATSRVVRGKGGRRWAQASERPNLCLPCALKAAGAINKANNIAARLNWLGD